MIRRLIKWWRARQRQIDLDILWPACRDQAADLAAARNAFLLHVSQDSAWQDLRWQDACEIVSKLQ